MKDLQSNIISKLHTLRFRSYWTRYATKFPPRLKKGPQILIQFLRLPSYSVLIMQSIVVGNSKSHMKYPLPLITLWGLTPKLLYDGIFYGATNFAATKTDTIFSQLSVIPMGLPRCAYILVLSRNSVTCIDTCFK